MRSALRRSVWNSHLLKMAKLSETQVEAALKSVYDPEIPVDVVALGLILRHPHRRRSALSRSTMTLTAPGCGMGPVLVQDIEDRVGQVPNVSSVRVELVFDPPWSRDMMSEEAQLELGLF